MFLQQLRREPTPKEIAKEVDVPLSRVLLCMGYIRTHTVSLDAQPDDENKDSLVDLLAASIDEPADEDELEMSVTT